MRMILVSLYALLTFSQLIQAEENYDSICIVQTEHEVKEPKAVCMVILNTEGGLHIHHYPVSENICYFMNIYIFRVILQYNNNYLMYRLRG